MLEAETADHIYQLCLHSWKMQALYLLIFCLHNVHHTCKCHSRMPYRDDVNEVTYDQHGNIHVFNNLTNFLNSSFEEVV